MIENENILTANGDGHPLVNREGGITVGELMSHGISQETLEQYVDTTNSDLRVMNKGIYDVVLVAVENGHTPNSVILYQPPSELGDGVGK